MTGHLKEYAFPLYDAEPRFLKACLREAEDGVSTPEIHSQLSDHDVTEEDLEVLAAFLKGMRTHISRRGLRTTYVLINACIYGLGAFEFQTLTGFSVADALNLNLRIAKTLYGCYDSARF